MTDQIPEKMQAVVCHGPHDYRLEEVAVPGAQARRGPDQGGGRRYLRQRPEVLPRRGEVLGRREPSGLGRDHGDPRPRVRRASGRTRRRGRRAVGDRGRRPRGLRADRAVLGMPVLQARASTTCASRTTSTVSSGAPLVRWRATWCIRRRRWCTRSLATSPAHHAAFAEPLSCSLHAVERGADHLRGHRRGRRLRADRARHGGGCPREEPDARDRARHGAGQARAGRGLRRRHHHQHRRAGRRRRSSRI